MIKRLYLDTETTGTDNQIHGIHQLSGYIELDGEVVETFDLKMKPWDGCEYTDEALEVGHVTRDIIDTYTPEAEVFLIFRSMLNRYVNRYDKSDKFVLIGYNAKFDKDMLYQLFVRNNDTYFFSLVWGNHLDIMSIATMYLESKRPDMVDFKLITVAQTLGFVIDEKQLHNALYDIWLTREIFRMFTINKVGMFSAELTPTEKEREKIIEEQKEQNPNKLDLLKSSLKPNMKVVTESEKNKLPPVIKINDLAFIINFGKFKGCSIEEIINRDSSYIMWLNDNHIRGIFISTEIINMAIKRISDNKNNWENQRQNNYEWKTPDYNDDDLPF